ncbi:MAG: hypothetical protein AAGI46_03620 [Planctomycetota bacterium]
MTRNPAARRSLRRLAGRLVLTATVAFGGFVTMGTVSGCTTGPGAGEITATPVFGTRERFSRIGRNIDIEAKMLNDDLDNLLLLRPVTGLTPWQVP